MASQVIKLERPLAIFDLEATGVNTQEDRIVEFGVTKLSPDGTRSRFCMRFDPQMPIPPAATAVHGISDADVKDCPTFESHARLIHAGIRDCDIGGFNLKAYDMPMLGAEFERAGVKWDWRKHKVIDAGIIFKKRNPRTLEAAVEYFLDRKHEGAHGAQADADATLDVIEEMFIRYGFESIDSAAAESNYEGEQRADLAGKLYYDAERRLCYAFGKSKGKRVADDVGYAEWMLSKDFAADTKALLTEELDRIEAGHQADQLVMPGGF
jgi:DNA polymerase III subunit epsilon